MNSSKSLFFVFGISALLFWSRIIPHEANFTPVLALCLLAGFASGGRAFGFLLPLSALFVSDLYLGFYPGWGMNYIALTLLIGMGFFMKSHLFGMLGMGLSGALTFFALSNLGVWYFSGLYSLDWQGLATCYYAALPFFRTTLISTLGTVMIASPLIQFFQKQGLGERVPRVF